MWIDPTTMNIETTYSTIPGYLLVEVMMDWGSESE